MRLTYLAFLSAGLLVFGISPERDVMGNDYGAQVATLVKGVHDEPHLHVRYDTGPAHWGDITESSYQRIYADGVRAFQEIYDTPIPAQIRQTFDRTILDCVACSDCAFTVLDGRKQVSIFTKKFIVVGLESDGFGDVVATLMFEGARHPFLLRMNKVGGRYELRNMTELPDPVGEGFVRQLWSSEYRQYWL